MFGMTETWDLWGSAGAGDAVADEGWWQEPDEGWWQDRYSTWNPYA
jgi:hypothetical protein